MPFLGQTDCRSIDCISLTVDHDNHWIAITELGTPFPTNHLLFLRLDKLYLFLFRILVALFTSALLGLATPSIHCRVRFGFHYSCKILCQACITCSIDPKIFRTISLSSSPPIDVIKRLSKTLTGFPVKPKTPSLIKKKDEVNHKLFMDIFNWTSRYDRTKRDKSDQWQQNGKSWITRVQVVNTLPLVLIGGKKAQNL